MSAANVAKCACGRPLRHTGRCIGFKANTNTAPKSHKKRGLSALLEAEVSVVHADIARLKGEIKDRQHALLDAETKLSPLVALLEVYQSKRIEGPAAAKPPSTLTVVAQPVVPARATAFALPVPPIAAVPDDDELPDEPVEADYNQVLRWASARNLHFKTWDDLPTINARREKYELPPFKRKLRS